MARLMSAPAYGKPDGSHLESAVRRVLPISPQTWAISALCLADLVSTVWLCDAHGAAEGNPLMSYFLSLGLLPFAGAKVAMTAGPLGMLEALRRRDRRAATLGLNTIIAAYLFIYLVGMARVNTGQSLGDALASLNRNPELAAVRAETRRRIEHKRQEALTAMPASGSRPRGDRLPHRIPL